MIGGREDIAADVFSLEGDDGKGRFARGKLKEKVLQYISPNNHCILGDTRCLFGATERKY